MDEPFLQALDDLRELVGKPFVINSGYRCPAHNREVGGAPNSQHLHGRAADIACHDAGMRYALLVAAPLFGMTGIGVAKTFVHVDNRRGAPAAWTY